MAISARRRIVVNVSTAVKQWRGIAQWSRTEIPISPRRINLSTPILVKQWKCPSIHCNQNIRHLSTDTATHDYDRFSEIGYTDVADLLSTPQRDFLVRSYNEQKVPVSSLKGKLIGLYFCENKAHPPRLHAINRVYGDAKSRGHDFEIVQITFDFHDKHPAVPTVQLFRDSVSWLTLPPTDPSFRKIQAIFQCVDQKAQHWIGDSLVLIYPPRFQPEAGVLFELSGARILLRWGIEGYPFTRQSLYKAEHELQKREVTLQFLFPPGRNLLLRPRHGGEGFDLVDAVSQLSGKRVLVLFAKNSFPRDGAKFLSMLKSEYEAQLEDDVAEESKFEVVYVSTGLSVSCFDEFTKDMPWMVQPFHIEAYWDCLYDVFKPSLRGVAAAVAFNEQGELIAKEDCLDQKEEGDNLRFPFIDQDLEKRIRLEVEKLCI